MLILRCSRQSSVPRTDENKFRHIFGELVDKFLNEIYSLRISVLLSRDPFSAMSSAIPISLYANRSLLFLGINHQAYGRHRKVPERIFPSEPQRPGSLGGRGHCSSLTS